MRLDVQPLPKSVRMFSEKPIMREAGFLYFEVEPWSSDRQVYLKVRSASTLLAVRYWLRKISTWSDVGCVTHLEGE